MQEILLNSKKQEHYSPIEIVKASKQLMGESIELDPASDKYANAIVKAERFYTKEDNSLNIEWRAKTVFLNPPGGVHNQRSYQCLFWDKLLFHWKKGDINQTIFLGFSLEILSKRGYEILDFPCCIPQSNAIANCVTGMGRLKFITYKDGIYKEQKEPVNGNVIVWLPPNSSYVPPKFGVFTKLFDKFGKCINDK